MRFREKLRRDLISLALTDACPVKEVGEKDMGFMKVLSGVRKGLEVATGVGREVAPLVPGIGGLFGTVLTAVSTVEHLIPDDSRGPVKKQIVTALVSAACPEVDVKDLSPAIDMLVTALNALAKASQ